MLSTGFLSRLLQVALQFSISFHAIAVRGAVSWADYFTAYALRLASAFASDCLDEIFQIFTALFTVDFVRLVNGGLSLTRHSAEIRSNFSPRAV